jgi:hypothetical protein
LARRGERVAALEERNAELEAEYRRLTALELDVARRTEDSKRQIRALQERIADIEHRRWEERKRAGRLAADHEAFVERAARILGR